MELKKAEQLAIEKIKVYCPEYVFKWDNAKSRFGCCFYRQKWISLSKTLVSLNSEEQVLDTILHEIAHALNPSHHHDRVWQRTAVSIGCNGNRCYNSKEVIGIEEPYIGTCPSCGKETKRFKRTQTACGDCCNKYNFGRYDDRYKLIWRKATT